MFPPPPPPLPPPMPGVAPLVFRRDDSSDTDFSKKIKSAKNKSTKSKLSKKEEIQMERERQEKFGQMNMEQEIANRMREILEKKTKEQKSVTWQDSQGTDIDTDVSEDKGKKKRKKIEKPKKKAKDTDKGKKKEKVKKMSKKEQYEQMKRQKEEQLEKLRQIDPEMEVERGIHDLLRTDANILAPKWDEVKTKEDLRVSTVWTTDKAKQLDLEKQRLDRELEKLDRDKEMERKMSELLTRKDPWRPEPDPHKAASPELTSVQGRVREAILRREREAQEKIQFEKERKERAERRRIIQERERLVREQREIERIERERIDREYREQRERELREMIRKEVLEELRKIPRPRKPSCVDNQCRNLMHCCIEFAANSPIEGCPGLVDRNNTIFEKVFYIATVFFSLYACFDMLLETYTKWSTAPFLTVADENPTAVWKIPFPAVTVCSEVKIRHRVLEYATYFDDIGDVLEREIPRDVFQKLLVSSTVCELPRNEGDEIMAEEDLDILAEVLPQLEGTLTSCKWRGTVEDCSAFTRMFKDEGVCFNFNMLDREDIFREEVLPYSDFLFHGNHPFGWTLTGGYPKEEETDTFPRRDRPTLPYPLVTHDDYNAGLVLTLETVTADYDPVCSKEQGWRIYLHHSVEVPGIHSQYIKVEPNKDMTISINPSSTSTEKLKKFPPEKRNCYYPNERNLTYYKTYTQNNCEMECLVNMTITYCECVTFYMPRTNTSGICGPVRQICAERAKEYNRVYREAFLQNEVATEKFIIDELGTSSKFFNVVLENMTDPNCGCRPTCEMVNYQLDIAQENLNSANDTDSMDPEVETVQSARIVIRYKDKAFVPVDKLEMCSFVDFISAVGAVLGTFMGISFGKAIEMFYVNFIRIMYNIKRYGIGYWAGLPEE